MALEVIGAGFGRTGTASLKAALEQLGYVKTHHMFEVMASRDQMRRWHDIALGNTPDWDEVFAGFPAAVDFPSASYWRELADYYPDAKVLLTVRSADSWWKSARSTIMEIGRVVPVWARRWVRPLRINYEMVNGTVWNRMFDGHQLEEDYAKQVFLDHIEEVKATIPAARLLVYEVKQGWEPLCAFLDKPVPETPFPHVNDTDEFLGTIRRVKLVFGAIHLAVVALVLGAAWWILS